MWKVIDTAKEVFLKGKAVDPQITFTDENKNRAHVVMKPMDFTEFYFIVCQPNGKYTEELWPTEITAAVRARFPK